MPAVACRVEAMHDAVRAATPEDLGGLAAQLRLDVRIAAVQRLVDGLGGSGAAPARGPVMRAVRQLRSLGSTVARSGRRGKIRGDVASLLTTRGREAVDDLLALLRRP